MTWLDRRSEILQDVIRTHGGVIRWTDDMIKKKWNNLTQSLDLAQRLKNPKIDNETVRNMLNRFDRIKEKIADDEKKPNFKSNLVALHNASEKKPIGSHSVFDLKRRL